MHYYLHKHYGAYRNWLKAVLDNATIYLAWNVSHSKRKWIPNTTNNYLLIVFQCLTGKSRFCFLFFKSLKRATESLSHYQCGTCSKHPFLCLFTAPNMFCLLFLSWLKHHLILFKVDYIHATCPLQLIQQYCAFKYKCFWILLSFQYTSDTKNQSYS